MLAWVVVAMVLVLGGIIGGGGIVVVYCSLLAEYIRCECCESRLQGLGLYCSMSYILCVTCCYNAERCDYTLNTFNEVKITVGKKRFPMNISM